MKDLHYLNDKWSVWYDDYRDNSLSKFYNQNLFLISSFEVIEVFFINKDFWCIYRNCPKITEIPEKTSFHLFKYSIKPLWL